MDKVIVFDLGGTLLEYKGMPLNWSEYYQQGFENVSKSLGLNASELVILKSVDIMKAYNPRFSGREEEIAPEIIFRDAIKHWEGNDKVEDIDTVIDSFFEGIELKAEVFEYSFKIINMLKSQGCKVACLTDLPNGMPDRIFKREFKELIDSLDLYVSSQSCGYGKPNKNGLMYIADRFGCDISQMLFVGDEDKDKKTAENAGCRFVRIDDYIKGKREYGNLGSVQYR